MYIDRYICTYFMIVTRDTVYTNIILPRFYGDFLIYNWIFWHDKWELFILFTTAYKGFRVMSISIQGTKCINGMGGNRNKSSPSLSLSLSLSLSYGEKDINYKVQSCDHLVYIFKSHMSEL